MGHRITHRSRARLGGYPWPLRTVEIAVGDLPTFPTDGFTFIGPLPAKAVMELVYRVKAMQLVGSCTVVTEAPTEEDPEATISTSYSEDDTMMTEEGVDELDVFERAQYRFDGDPVVALALGSEAEFGGVQPINSQLAPPSLTQSAEIFATGADEFYLSGNIRLVLLDIGRVDLTNVGSSGLFEEFTADLVLACGSFPISMTAESGDGQPTASSLTITATEWFPFADTAGSPAWDTATGASANLGPGG